MLSNMVFDSSSRVLQRFRSSSSIRMLDQKDGAAVGLVGHRNLAGCDRREEVPVRLAGVEGGFNRSAQQVL